jgi:hypothetical protein
MPLEQPSHAALRLALLGRCHGACFKARISEPATPNHESPIGCARSPRPLHFTRRGRHSSLERPHRGMPILKIEVIAGSERAAVDCLPFSSGHRERRDGCHGDER